MQSLFSFHTESLVHIALLMSCLIAKVVTESDFALSAVLPSQLPTDSTMSSFRPSRFINFWILRKVMLSRREIDEARLQHRFDLGRSRALSFR